MADEVSLCRQGGLLSFGPYPTVSLKAAREKRDETRRQIEGGRDPAVEKRRQETRARLEAATTFKAVADEVIAKAEKDGKAPATLKAARRYLSLLRKLHTSPRPTLSPSSCSRCCARWKPRCATRQP